MGWRDAGCYGSTFYETPNIDRLAKQGMRFTNAYAACPRVQPDAGEHHDGQVPGAAGHDRLLRRAATGHRHGTGRGTSRCCPPVTWITCRWRKRPSPRRSARAVTRRSSPASGIWAARGIGRRTTASTSTSAAARRASPSSYFSPYGNPKLPDGPKGEHLDDRMAAESVKFLEHVGDKPFLLYHAFYSVHIPLQAKQDLIAKYEAKRKTVKHDGPVFRPEGDRQARQIQDHAVYAAMIETMDHSVGQVLDALDRLGLAESTVVFFMSDNGGLSTAEGAPTSNLPLRAGKGWLYEGGIREPMIVKWPGVVKPQAARVPRPSSAPTSIPRSWKWRACPHGPGSTLTASASCPLLRQTASLPSGRLLALPALWQPRRKPGRRRACRRLEAHRVL